MKTNTTSVVTDDSSSSFSRPKVVCDFLGGYEPPINVARIAEEMLDSVPPKFLNGLAEVVLTNTAGLPRKLRRSVTKSRGRKVRKASSLGLYHPAWNNHQAWIQIYVDNTLKYWAEWFWFFLPIVRRMAVAGVLFHEIGHHIHFTTRPEHREREDVADDWKDKLSNNYFRSRYPWLKNALRPFMPFLTRYTRAKAGSLYQSGTISRHEYEKSKK